MIMKYKDIKVWTKAEGAAGRWFELELGTLLLIRILVHYWRVETWCKAYLKKVESRQIGSYRGMLSLLEASKSI